LTEEPSSAYRGGGRAGPSPLLSNGSFDIKGGKVERLIRILGVAVLALLGIHIVDYAFGPLLPLLITLFVMALVVHLVMGHRGL
jgi:hypothetical protein